MVSRVAVIALVAIVACPILLGYAMNLSETTVTDYKMADDSVNVTQFLQNDVIYTSVSADTYAINSNFSYVANPDNNPTYYSIVPIYEKFSSVYSSLPLFKGAGNQGPGQSATDSISNFNKYYVIWDYGGPGYVGMTVYSGSNVVATLSQVKEVYYDKGSDSITYVYSGANLVNTISGGNYTSWIWTNNSGVVDHSLYGYQRTSNNTRYVDISAGFHLENNSLVSSVKPSVDIPSNTKSIMMTVNLDSITDSSYNMTINVVPSLVLNGGLKLVKTTTGGTVSWQCYRGSTFLSDLYYDSNRNDNTYQIIFTLDDPYQYGTNSKRYDFHYELRYVGGWPDMFGEANYYMKYSYDGGTIIGNTDPPINGISGLYFSDLSNKKTPVMRVDAALISGLEVNVISDQTYSAASFRSNPATTLNNISNYGNAIRFGGNTYTVDGSGNITIGSHKVPLNGIVFDSIPVSGGYENRINKTVISTTAQPSDIQFDGSWSASVSTASMESYTYTHTEWTPGHFGWDGIDQNFLMVGLLTSIGVFIALGLYVRRSRSSLWPLLVVCGGAVVLFFIML